jgi:hypothetical protein
MGMKRAIGPTPEVCSGILREHLGKVATVLSSSIYNSIATAQGKDDGRRRTDGPEDWFAHLTAGIRGGSVRSEAQRKPLLQSPASALFI